MLDIKKNHPASSLFRAYNSVPAASAEWLYWQYNLCWAECQHQGLAFFLRGSVNRFSVNFFSIEVITASPSFFRTIQVCCVDIEIKTDFTAHIRRTRILKYTKSLSIADQFPGFNIISVFFLTAFHSLISATASLMISAGFIRTALLWNIFSPCRVGRRRLCLTVPVSEQ